MLDFVDSFSHYNSIFLKWDTAYGGAVSINTVGGPRGAGCLQFNGFDGNGQAFKTYPADRHTITHGFRAKKFGTPNTTLLTFWDNDQVQVNLIWRADFRLEIRGGDGSLLAVSANPTLGNTWTYIEVSITFDDPAGVCQVRIDENLEINFSGKTKYTDNAFATQFSMGDGGNGSYTLQIADLYVANPDAPAPTSFIGDCEIDAEFPNAPGFYTEFTPFPGAPNWDQVNENPPDGDTSYVEGTDLGIRDTYGFAPIPVAVGTVVAVAVNLDARKTVGGPIEISALARSAAVDLAGDPIPIPSNYHVLQTVFAQNPATSAAWTIAEVDAAEFGQQLRGGEMLYEDGGEMLYEDGGVMEFV